MIDGIASPAALRAYVTGGLREIDGWLGGDATWIITELSRQQLVSGTRGAVLEIGVHHGQLFLLLALNRASGEAAVGIDLFEDQDQNLDNSGCGSRELLERNAVSAGVAFDELVLLQRNSLDVRAADILNATAGQKARLFSVDGGHSAELTVNDLRLAADSITDDGIVILDDAFSPMWPGVMTGLVQFLSGRKPTLVPFGLVGNKTLLCRPGQAERWFEALEPAGAYFQTRIDYFNGHLVRILLDSVSTANSWHPVEADWFHTS